MKSKRLFDAVCNNVRSPTETCVCAAAVKPSASLLADIVAWLLANSMRSERLQHLALCQQILHNTWRKAAFKTLVAEPIQWREPEEEAEDPDSDKPTEDKKTPQPKSASAAKVNNCFLKFLNNHSL